MKIGLFFGSFNPIHVGHLIIANYMVTHTDLKQVWLVVSPQNPFKKKSTLANDYDRLHLVRLAIEDNPNLRASKIEFGLPQPIALGVENFGEDCGIGHLARTPCGARSDTLITGSPVSISRTRRWRAMRVAPTGCQNPASAARTKIAPRPSSCVFPDIGNAAS